MNKSLLLVKHMFRWHRMDCIRAYASFFIGLIFFNFLKGHDFFQFCLVLLVFLIQMVFWIKSSLFPLSNDGSEGFTVKYLAALPMTRKEFFWSVGISSELRAMPMILTLSFLIFPYFSGASSPKCLINSIVLVFAGSITGIRGRFISPRITHFNKKYSGIYTKISTSIIVGFLTFASILFYSLYRWIEFVRSYFYYFKTYFYGPLSKGVEFLETFSLSWYFPLLLMVLTILEFNHILSRWADEESSYPKKLPNIRLVNVVHKGTLYTFLAVVTFLYFSSPIRYSDSDLLCAVYDKDYQYIQKAIANGEDINHVNKHGYNALMAAATEGDMEMFLFLESQKGTVRKAAEHSLLEKAIRSKNEDLVAHIITRGYGIEVGPSKNNHHPLHEAAEYCMTSAVDLLLEKGVPFELIDQKGRSALHYAARKHCHGAVISLLSKGINTSIKDKEGKLAVEYITNKDLLYLFEKMTRAPAGKQ